MIWGEHLCLTRISFGLEIHMILICKFGSQPLIKSKWNPPLIVFWFSPHLPGWVLALLHQRMERHGCRPGGSSPASKGRCTKVCGWMHRLMYGAPVGLAFSFFVAVVFITSSDFGSISDILGVRWRCNCVSWPQSKHGLETCNQTFHIFYFYCVCSSSPPKNHTEKKYIIFSKLIAMRVWGQERTLASAVQIAVAKVQEKKFERNVQAKPLLGFKKIYNILIGKADSQKKKQLCDSGIPATLSTLSILFGLPQFAKWPSLTVASCIAEAWPAMDSSRKRKYDVGKTRDPDMLRNHLCCWAVGQFETTNLAKLIHVEFKMFTEHRRTILAQHPNW